jgi:EthD domain
MPDPFKLIILPATKAGMTRAELQDYLEYSHGPLVMKHPDVSGRFTEYVHHYIESTSGLHAGHDAVTIIGFASASDLTESTATENYRVHVGPDENNFRDEEASRAYSGVTRMIRDGPPDTSRKLLIFRRLRDGRDASTEWENHVSKILSGGAFGVTRVAVNRLSPLGGPPDFDILEEIGLSNTSDIAAIESALEATPAGFRSGSSVALITRPRCFV